MPSVVSLLGLPTATRRLRPARDMRRLPPGGPAPETPPPADRRGPFRPERLVSSRARLQGRAVVQAFRIGDALAVLAIGLLAHRLTGAGGAFDIAAGLSVLICVALARGYRFSRREPWWRHELRIALGFMAGLGLPALAVYPMLGPGPLLALAGLWAPPALLALLALHMAWREIIRRWRLSGRLASNVVVVGATGAAERLIASALLSREVNILGIFDDRAARAPKAIHGVPVLGSTDALISHRIMPYVDRVVITVPSLARARVSQLMARLRVLPNEITLLIDDADSPDEAQAVSRMVDVPLAHISGDPLDQRRALLKRLQDVAFAVPMALVAMPVMLLIALAIRLDSPGPILFRQRRHGFNNEEIVVWKFRSMRPDSADPTATRQVSAEDDRVTRVGRFIRMTSLDELPQILNVLKGEMSLVGPRPHAVGMMTGDIESRRLVAEYAHRHRMKPGMTGWAAIHGSRGPVDTPELVRRRVVLDIEYIERQSFWLDLYIMLMTIPCLLGDYEAVR